MSTFAKSLRRRARERIAGCQALAAAHSARRTHWVRAAFWVAAEHGNSLAAVIGLPFLLLVGTLLVLGPIAVELFDGRRLEFRPPTSLALAAHAHFVAGFLALAIAAAERTAFCAGLKRLAYMPEGDFQSVRRSDRIWIPAIVALAVWTFLVFRFLAFYERLPFSQLLFLVPLAAFHAWMVYAIAVVAVGLIRRTSQLMSLMGRWILLSLSGYLLCQMAMAWPKELPPLLAGYFPWPKQPPEWLAPLASYSGLLLPTGWVDAIAWHAVIRGEAWGWLFLLPCAALSALALWCRPRLIVLREIRVSSQGALTPVFADDPDPELSEGAIAATAVTRSELPQPVTPDRPALLKRLLAGPPLGKCDWSRGWPLERLLGRLLSERQRVVMQFMCGGMPSATIGWFVGLAFGTLFGSLWLLLLAFSSEPPPPMLGAIWAMLPLVVCCTISLSARSSTPRQSAALPCHPVYPIGLREATAASLKGAFCLLLSWLPLFAIPVTVAAVTPATPPATGSLPSAGDGLAALLRHGGPVGSYCVMLAAALCIIALAAVGACTRFAVAERYELSLHQVCYLVVLTVAVLATFTMALSPFWPVTLIAALIVGASAVAICFYFDWLYCSGRLDYNDWRPPAEKGNGRQVR